MSTITYSRPMADLSRDDMDTLDAFDEPTLSRLLDCANAHIEAGTGDTPYAYQVADYIERILARRREQDAVLADIALAPMLLQGQAL